MMITMTVTMTGASSSNPIDAAPSNMLQTDTSPPVTTVTLIGTPGNNDWFMSDVIVELSAADNDSAFADIFCAIDRDPTIQSCQEPFYLTAEGLHWVYFYAEDAAGNLESMQRVEVKIDKTPPEVNLQLNYDPPLYTRVNLLIPRWVASDTTSGMCNTYGWIQTLGGTIVSPEPIMSGQPSGLFWLIPQLHEIGVLAQDCAGWETEVRSPFEIVATLKSMQDALVLLPAQQGNGLPGAVYDFLHDKLTEAQNLKDQHRLEQLRTLLEDTFIEPDVQYLPPRIADMFVMDAWYIIYSDTIVEPTPTPPQPEAMIVRPRVTVAPLDEPITNSTLYMIESDVSEVQKSGTWAIAFAPDASGNSYLYSSGSTRDALTINFTGAQINIVIIEHTAPSEFAVELDGERIGTVDTRTTQGSFGAQALVHGFPSGQHMLKIIAVSGNVAIDAFLVESRFFE